MVKYVLVVSQYYHSYVQAVCEVENNIVYNARKMIEELELYKRQGEECPFHYGDLDDIYAERTSKVLKNGGRININDEGDIYLEFSDSIMRLTNEIKYYIDKSNMAKRANCRKRGIENDIADHHDSQVVLGIIAKYFSKQNDNNDPGVTKRNKAKYITSHNNYKDVLTLGKTYDICEEKEEWLLIKDDRGECQYYRKDCFEINGGLMNWKNIKNRL